MQPEHKQATSTQNQGIGSCGGYRRIINSNEGEYFHITFRECTHRPVLHSAHLSRYTQLRSKVP